jgi:hypothetical protein
VRQGYFPPGVKVDVGIMCAAPGGPGLRRHLRQSQARTRLAQRAPNFMPKSISAGAEPVVTIRAFAKRIVTLLLVRPLVGLLPATHE